MSESEHELDQLPEAAVPARANPASVPTGADLIQSVTRLDRAIKARRDSDVKLVNWWLYLLVLSWVTLGIYPIYLYFKRIGRINGFGRRKRAYYEALLEWTERQAAARGKEDVVDGELVDLRSEVADAFERSLRPIRAGLSLLLTLLTLGIYGLVVLHRINRYWWDAQVFEQDFDDKLSLVWIKLDIIRYPLTYRIDQRKRRSYPLYLILSIVTIGIWGLVWDHKIHTDPDNLYSEYHSLEDSVLHAVRFAVLEPA